MAEEARAIPSIGACTDVGRLRDHNEDAFGYFPERRLFIVADGMGGHNAGEVASDIAVKALDESISLDALAGALGDQEKLQALIVDAVMGAHAKIRAAARANADYHGMGCTVVLALRDGPQWHICNVGDSRAYLVDEQEIKLLTRDHTVVMGLVESGQMTMSQARASEEKHRLTQALGIPYPVEPFHALCEPTGPAWLLLCSDGLWDMLSDQQIAEIARAYQSDHELCRELIRAANAAGGEDNITIIALPCGQVDLGH